MHSAQSKACAPLPRPLQQPSPLRPASSFRASFRKDAWGPDGVPQLRPIHLPHGARGVQRGDTGSRGRGGRCTPALARTQPRPELAPSTACRARSLNSRAPATSPNSANTLFAAAGPCSPGPLRGALSRRRTGSLSSSFLPVAPKETELSLQTRGPRAAAGSEQIRHLAAGC